MRRARHNLLRKASTNYTEMVRNDPQSIKEADRIQVDIKGIPSTQSGTFRQIVNDNFGNGWILTPVNQTDYRLTMQPTYALKLKQDTLTQSMSTIEKKINGLGVAESSVLVILSGSCPSERTRNPIKAWVNPKARAVNSSTKRPSSATLSGVHPPKFSMSHISQSPMPAIPNVTRPTAQRRWRTFA